MKQETKLTSASQLKNSTFYLCEKPSQAKTLAKILCADIKQDGMFFGDGIIVGYAYGHLLTLAMPEEYIGRGPWRMDSLPILPNIWKWMPIKKQKHTDHLKKIGEYLKFSDSVVIATDPDDEGEVIGRRILIAHDYTGKVSRLWASALNPAAIHNALQNLLPLTDTDTFYYAGCFRHELDWLYGINLSRAISLRLNRTTSVGRVKTRLLHELVLRGREIDSFVPASYNTACITVGDTVLEWQPGMGPIHSGDGLLSLPEINRGVCLSAELVTEILPPPLPYTLSALLADASDLGIPLKNGYDAAQALYEAGAISYPRSNSTKMPGMDVEDFTAHHAIITTKEICPPDMTGDAKQIFNLIQLNVTYQYMDDAHLTVRRLTFNFGGEIFCSKDSWLEDQDLAGWQLIATANDKKLTLLQSGTTFNIGDEVQGEMQIERKRTMPPQHYTEATLLRMMALNGIGTESTRVDTISKLLYDKLAEVAAQMDKCGKTLIKSRIIRSTSRGCELINKLPEAVTGPTMDRQLKLALKSARDGQSDASGHLLAASTWLAQTIHGTCKK